MSPFNHLLEKVSWALLAIMVISGAMPTIARGQVGPTRGHIERPTSAPKPGEPDNGLTNQLPKGIKIGGGPFLHATPGPGGSEILDTPMAYYTSTKAFAGTGYYEQDFLEGPGYQTQSRSMSWLYWWELNREKYLYEARSKRQTPIPAIEPPADAAKAMLMAAESKNVVIRREAILALGRVRQSGALTVLQACTKDSDDICRLRAWVSIGLLDTPQAMTFLQTPPPANAIDRIGWTVCVGMLTEPDAKLWEMVRARLLDSQLPEAQRLAVRAIQSHRPSWGRQKLIDAIRPEFSDAVLQAILQAIGANQDPADIPDLVALARAAPDGCQWPGIRAIYQQAEADKRRAGLRGASRPTGVAEARLRSMRRSALLALSAYMEKLTDPGATALRAPLTTDVTNITLQNDITKRQVLLLGGGLSNPISTEMAVQDCCILGLGQFGSVDDFDLLRRLVGMDIPTGEPKDDSVLIFAYDKRRGDAAIALGFLLRSGGANSAAEDALTTLFQQGTAINCFRAASAVAMGMSGHESLTPLIKRPLQDLLPGQEPVLGYAVTALGMLGDREAIDWFNACLEGPAKRIDIAGLSKVYLAGRPAAMTNREFMSRRAAVQGLAALGEPDAIPSLVAQWGKHPLLDTEVARAILWCRREPLTPGDENYALIFGQSLAQLAAQEKIPQLAASAVASLGHFFDRGGGRRLATLIEGSDWEMLAYPLPPPQWPDYHSAQVQVVSLANPVYPATLRPLNLHERFADRLIYYQGKQLHSVIQR